MTKKTEVTEQNSTAGEAQTTQTATRKAPRTEEKLIKEHRHAGKDLAVGDTIKVTARQRKWLQEMEVIAAEAK